jgi:ABC-type sugar transport system substrate-binding protein
MFRSVTSRLRSQIGAAALGLAIASGGLTALVNPAFSKDIKLEFSSSAVDANWKKMIQSMNDYMPEIGKQHDATITLNVSDAGMNVDKQISDIQTASVKQPSVLLIDPVDGSGVLPAANAAKAAGIKLFNIRPADTDPEGLYDGKFVFSVETPYADNMKAWVNSMLDADPKLMIKAAIIYGGAAQKAQLSRGDAIKELAKARPDRVTVVAEKFGDWSLEVAQNATADFITAHPDLNLVVAANNQMAMGSANAIASAGKTGAIHVGSYDIDIPTVQAIIDGKISFTTGLEFRAIGRAILLASVEIAEGKYKGELDLKPVYAVSKANAAEILTKLAP